MADRHLSAEELLKSVNEAVCELPQRGGVKEFVPDGSWLQRKRLDLFYEERKQVLSEERVKRKGRLMKAEWKPEIEKVEIVGKPNKSLMTYGHAEKGRFFLHVEEAVSLLEKGDLEVYYKGLPLSLQEAYSSLLGDRVPLEHYQVYNHLSRLGYVIFRHTPVEKVSQYEKDIGLSHVRSSKRKRERQELIFTDQQSKMTRPDAIGDDQEFTISTNTNHASSDTDRCSAYREPMDYTELCTTPDDRCHTENKKCFTDSQTKTESKPPANLRWFTCNIHQWCEGDERHIRSHSDLSEVKFPDFSHLGSRQTMNLADISVLPPGIQVTNSFRNIEHMSVSYDRKADSITNFSIGCQSLLPRVEAVNWSEYKRQQLQCQSNEDELLVKSPVGHLWKGDTQPLVKPSQATSTASLLHRMKIIQNINFMDDTERYPKNCESGLNFTYDVYSPDTNFSKRNPGPPAFRLCIVKQNEPCPELTDFLMASRLSPDEVPVQWAVVDQGDVTFYSFNGVDLPRDIAML